MAVAVIGRLHGGVHTKRCAGRGRGGGRAGGVGRRDALRLRRSVRRSLWFDGGAARRRSRSGPSRASRTGSLRDGKAALERKHVCARSAGDDLERRPSSSPRRRPRASRAVNYTCASTPVRVEGSQRVRGGAWPGTMVFGSYVQDWLLSDTTYNWGSWRPRGGSCGGADSGTHWADLVHAQARGRGLCADCAPCTRSGRPRARWRLQREARRAGDLGRGHQTRTYGRSCSA